MKPDFGKIIAMLAVMRYRPHQTQPMFKILIAVLVTILLSITACSRRTVPQKPNNPNVIVVMPSASDTAAVAPIAKPAAPVTKAVKTPTAKSIVLNDAAAKKSVDGRLYYDLEGHRYWKNYKDGRYYIFNKNMQGNPDYKPRN